ncbi:hypothetical protein ABBQ32_013025 [Trebouxia sp. C0010 RCD-2024]
MEVQHAAHSPPPVTSSWKEHIVQNYLPLVFAVAIIVAMSWPTPGLKVSSLIVKGVHVIQALNTFLVFLVSGLTLNISDLRAALKAWLGLLYGVPAILFITPCLGFAAGHLHLQPPEFRTGLAIFCAVPTTLGVGVSLTAAAKGNQALALFLTVFTNLLGIVTVPFGLKLVLAGTDTLSVNPARLVASLLLTVLVPTILGMLCSHYIRWVAVMVKRHKVKLTLFSHTNLAMIIWQTLSGARAVLVAQRVTSILVIIAVGILQHLIYLAFNALAVIGLRLQVREAIAVLIMTSTKSAPVAVTVIAYVSSDTKLQGLLSVPAIIGQLAQIFMGSCLVRLLSKLVKEPVE